MDASKFHLCADRAPLVVAIWRNHPLPLVQLLVEPCHKHRPDGVDEAADNKTAMCEAMCAERDDVVAEVRIRHGHLTHHDSAAVGHDHVGGHVMAQGQECEYVNDKPSIWCGFTCHKAVGSL